MQDCLTLSVRPHLIWLKGALTPEKLGDLVIPVCQSRTFWIGFFTVYADLKNSITVKVIPIIWMLEKNGLNRYGGVFA